MPFNNGMPRKPLTFRVENIPAGTSKDDLKSFFYAEDQKDIYIESLVPAVDNPENEEDGDLTATVLFNAREGSVSSEPRSATDIISIDKDFHGFTPLYVPSKGPIAADIIAITGLAGHAYGSWAHSAEKMWLRDYLPKDAPNARILTYGYPSALYNGTSRSILADHTNTFVHRLIDMRETAQCESRPMILIGHSLGCLIIKKALTDVGLMGVNMTRLPVRAIIFLAAPHRGLNTTALETLVKGEASELLISELRSDSPTLTDLNARFAQIAKDIDILTCYETQKTKTAIRVADGTWKREGPEALMVSPSSAQQFTPREKLVSVDANHSQIARIKKGQNGIYPNIKSTIRHALLSNAKIVASAIDTTIEVKETDINMQTQNLSHINLNQRSLSDDASSTATLVTPSKIEHTSTSSSNPNSKSTAAFSKNRLSIFRRSGPSSRANPLHEKSDSMHSEESLQKSKPSEATGPAALVLDHDSEMVKALKLGNTAKLDALMRDITLINKPDKNGVPPLVVAAKLNLEAGLDVLLSHGASIDVTDSDGITPLMAAILEGNPRIVQTLVNSGASLDTYEGEDDSTPLHLAVEKEDHEILAILLAEKPKLEVFNAFRITPLFAAVEAKDEEATRQLLRAGANTETPATDKGHTAIIRASRNGDLNIVETLIEYGARVNARTTFNENTSLILASEHGHLDVVKALLREGADFNATTSSKKFNPLSAAASHGHADVVEILLQAGAPMNAVVEPLLETPLIKAASRNQLAVVRALLLAGADPNMLADILHETDLDRASALIAASSKGYTDVVEELIYFGAKVNLCSDKFNYSALLAAARYGHSGVVKLLMSKGADIEASCDPDQLTPLVIAAEFGHAQVVEELLARGANITARIANDECSLIRAVEYGHTEVVEILLGWEEAEDTFSEKDTSEALCLAASKGYADIVGLLLDAGADPDARDASGDLALGVAILNGHTDTVKKLVSYGAGLDWIAWHNDNGYPVRPLYLAAHHGHVDIVRLLLQKNVDSSSSHAGYKKWEALEFDDEVLYKAQQEIIRLLQEHEKIRHPRKSLKFWK